MPSKNSINKPKDKILKKSHASSLGKKRSSRLQSTSRSSTGRYNTRATPAPTDSKAIALYTGKIPITNKITTQTLSKKKAKKLVRNQKYVEKRNELLKKDLDEKMEVESDSKVKISESEKLNNQLWENINNKDILWFKRVPNGEVTLIGVQSFESRLL